MENIGIKYFDVLGAKKIYEDGGNVTEFLRFQKGLESNTPDVVELAYDLQAGSYIDYFEKNMEQASLYAFEVADILDGYVSDGGSVLDVGTGEMTTLSLICQKIKNKSFDLFSFDVSWSRIYKGLGFAKRNMGKSYDKLNSFVAEMGEIPLLDKSVKITTSSHALEPNGGRLHSLMQELFRVTLEKIIIFEPCYEINSKEGRERMDRFGYIKNIDGVVESLGGVVVDKILIKNIINPLNPTVCFVISPPKGDFFHDSVGGGSGLFSVPGTNYSLEKIDDFYFSKDTGLCFPILNSVPVLRSKSAILASALDV